MSVCVLHNTSPCNVFVSPVFTCCTLWFLQSLAAFVSLDSFAAPTRVQANFFLAALHGVSGIVITCECVRSTAATLNAALAASHISTYGDWAVNLATVENLPGCMVCRSMLCWWAPL
jgi:hypothetical protein